MSAATGRPPVVLDFDASVGPLAGERRIGLGDWQEAIRFGCGLGRFAALRAELAQRMPAAGAHGTVWMGSGDFHHLSWLLIERQLARAPASGGPGLRVVVLDNHPDNMRFPFGVHCGSWVRRVALLPGVAQVQVVGITSADIGAGHAWENYLTPLWRGKLGYWSIGVDTSWARWAGAAKAMHGFADAASLVDALCRQWQADPLPTYLSIDKDVFAPEVVRTNWDQGVLREAEAQQLIAALRGSIVASDITGDVSDYRYRTAWKRWLSHADAQDTTIDAAQLQAWQADQHALNARLAGYIADVSS